jgi:DNA-binding beta-propeller fold protein YncE
MKIKPVSIASTLAGCQIKSSQLAVIMLAVSIFSLLPNLAPAEDLAKARLLVANKGDRTLSIIDPVSNQQIAAVAEEGQTGHEVVATPDGRRAFVPIYGNSGVGKYGTDGQLIRVIDLAKQSIVGTIDLGAGQRPHCARIGPKNGLLYVTTELENCLTVIDPDSLKIVGTVPTGQPESHMLIINSSGLLGYTANVGPGTVSVLDLAARKLLKVIPISKSTQRIAISKDDRWVFTADQIKPQIVVIDTSSNEVAKRIDLPTAAYGTDTTPDGHWLIMALPGSNEVGVLDIKTMAVVRTIKVPGVPQEVLVRPDGEVAYVSCDASKQVAVIDLKEWKVRALINTGKGTDGLAWAQAQ